MRGVLTIGTFDLFHRGHQRLLERAATFGTLFVGVNSDRFVREYKRRDAADSQDVRVRNVAALACVEQTVVNDGPGIDLIRDVSPSLLVIGSDWLPPADYPAQLGTSAGELAGLGVAVLFLPRTPGVSTTELLHAT